jgi:phosphatidylglycerophosphate synthase
MSPHLKWGIAGVAVGLILLGILGSNFWWLAFALIVVAIAIPTTAWLMLDESQRRRYRELRRRREIR